MRILLPVLSLLVPAAAAAFEVMPAAGYAFGGSFEAGDNADVDLDETAVLALSLRMRPNAGQEWELCYSRQATAVGASVAGGSPAFDVDVEYLQLGGSYFPTRRDFAPYVLGGLGIARFTPDLAGPGSRSKFALSLGLGVRLPVAANVAFRLEGRGFLTFADTDAAFFCSSDESGGACLIKASGSTVWQVQMLLGFAVTF
ncbi:MAG: outer membrane beta-barrel protein [Steroidobacteraceae bacterium]